jgi:putative endonuclease
LVLGEEMAVEFLRKDGLSTNQLHFSKQKLIFLPKKENTLAVVEVKTRSSLNLIASGFC